MRATVLCSAIAMLSCGLETTPQHTTTSTAPLCGTEPRVNPDGTATAISCPFEQQYDNITHHGTHFATVEQLRASSTLPGVGVTDSCGSWYLGTDANGVTVFISAETGEVRSHGQVHPGFQESVLPASLPLPITAAR